MTKRKLFEPIKIKNVQLKNRIVMSPMCMYSSEQKDGMVTPFHMTHYESRAIGQTGLIMIEATAVVPEGRITDQDLGIWSDEHIEGLKQLTSRIHDHGAKAAIQLAHAGRKANLESDIFAPSPISFNERMKTPLEMSQKEIHETIAAFKKGAIRAKESRFDMIEIHGAHGYLINQFLSPLSNKRTDQYGGNRENRYRLLAEIIDAVKEVWDGPLFVRISANEYDENGNTFNDMIYFAKEMKKQGVDLIDCSSGAIVPAKINAFPGYQVPYAENIKKEADILTGAVGLITTGVQAEEILQNNRADLIFIGRSLLKNPYWAKQAADELNYPLDAPKQYVRGW